VLPSLTFLDTEPPDPSAASPGGPELSLDTEVPKLPPSGRAMHVRHVQLLNREPFWWLMAAVVFCVGVAVIQVEVRSTEGEEITVHKEGAAAEQPAPDEHQRQREVLRQQPAEQGDGSAEAAGEAQAYESDSSPPAQEGYGYGLNDSLHLAFCTVALNVLMLVWGVTQEFVMTNSYKDVEDGVLRQVPSTVFVVLCNRLAAVAFTWSLLQVRGKQPVLLWLSSLEFISFTFQTVVKSGKLLPVVVLSSLRGKKTHNARLCRARGDILRVGGLRPRDCE
jgi:hypothetical protein